MTSRQVDELVGHVIATHSLGRRAARRFVARNLTRETLDHWRAFGAFPVRDTASLRRLLALDPPGVIG